MGTTKSGAQSVELDAPAYGETLAVMGRRIRELRTRRGFSLQEFAGLAGLGSAILAALERGDEGTSIGAVCAAADALGVPVASLFDDGASTPVDRGVTALRPAAESREPAPRPEPRALRPEPRAADTAPRPDAASRATPKRSEGEPPPGYVPLEMPELWEPPSAAESAPSIEDYETVAPRVVSYAPEPTFAAAPVLAPVAPVAESYAVAPAPTPHVAVARVAPAPSVAAARTAPVSTGPRAGARATEPRTFADLRVGVLAERDFATLPQFAVAAIVEAGFPVSVVAKIFRVPTWRLEGWIRDGVPAAPAGGKPVHRHR